MSVVFINYVFSVKILGYEYSLLKFNYDTFYNVCYSVAHVVI